MSRPEANVPVKRRRWWPWLLALGLALLSITGCLTVNHLLARWATAREVTAAVAELDRTELGWRLEDIEAARAVYPDEENGARYVEAAHALLAPSWPPQSQARGQRTPLTLETEQGPLDLTQALTPPQLPDEQSAAELRAELGKVAAAVEAARKLADHPYGRHVVAWRDDYPKIPLPHDMHVRDVTLLLGHDALLRSFDGDADGACLAAQAAFNAARSLGDEPVTLSHHVRTACTLHGLNALQRALAQGEPGVQHLTAWQELVEREEEETPAALVNVFRGERAMQHRFMEALDAGRVTLWQAMDEKPGYGEPLGPVLSVPIHRRSHAVMLRCLTEYVEAAGLPPEEQAARAQALKAHRPDERAPEARLFLPALEKTVLATNQKYAQLRCAGAALAAERYRREKGRWPETLATLVPDYLDDVPIDPFDGQPLRLARPDDGLVVYSVGPDGHDDGGTLDWRNPKRPGTDLGFRLWDVDKRRQPPPPRPPAEMPPGGGSP
jgi:hypothetical protein